MRSLLAFSLLSSGSQIAYQSALNPSLVVTSTSAPRSSSSATVSACPPLTAPINAVCACKPIAAPSSAHIVSIVTPWSSKALTQAVWPRLAA